MSKNLILEQTGSIAIISLNRENVYNALNRETKHELTELFKTCSLDSSIRSIILTGKGKAFCTGQDLNDRQDMTSPDLGKTLIEEWNPLILSMRNCSKIIIAAVNGVCAGAGVSLALNCDLVVSAPNVSFVSAFTKLGLIPDSGATSIIVNTIGSKRAMDFLLLPNKKKAQILYDWGLINRLEDSPLNGAIELAQLINSLAPLACSQLKKNIIEAADLSFEHSLDKEVKAQRILGKSSDFQEGIQSFFDKRPANFRGA